MGAYVFEYCTKAASYKIPSEIYPYHKLFIVTSNTAFVLRYHMCELSVLFTIS